MSSHTYISLPVAAVIRETHDSCSFEFSVSAELRERFKYRPGQFLTLRIPHGDDWLPRCYSLSSSPYESENLRVTVKRVDDGRGSNWLCDQVRPGDLLQTLPPAGAFVPKSLEGDFLLLAGGSGITPVLSILRSVLSQAQGRVRLVYANRDEQSVIFRDLLQQLVADYPQRLQVVHWLASVQGHPSSHQLAHLAAGYEAAQAFICGPEPFMDAGVAALKQAGLASSAIHVERFVSLPGESEQPVATVVEHAGATATRLTVELDGETREIECAPGEILLAAMQREGLEPPHSCLVGSCASCMCTLVAGKVDLLHNDALDQQELSEGWTLACQAVATSDQVHLRFPD
ncbi:2Fe-2S iron-sulfur cluster-binding protein [Halopseudomonas phragmitis]|uniref:3-ketosteroid-9-alpha-hydroxylase n=1 Tax=Halopseudomonas phragmitis TaxID=1931241 RepID=A0A1V0B9C0_9GAMM|nr:ferredoxin--NADP reductase [Halopseudomonas phragmitis]AQZ96512.1 3-ketosteroid-9-alpha-hydroxylase [Halopseudomonas phragmitis]